MSFKEWWGNFIQARPRAMGWRAYDYELAHAAFQAGQESKKAADWGEAATSIRALAYDSAQERVRELEEALRDLDAHLHECDQCLFMVARAHDVFRGLLGAAAFHTLTKE